MGQMADALQLHDESGVPLRRLATLWRNERWRGMITRWCGTAVRRATFRISTWDWMISCRIDDRPPLVLVLYLLPRPPDAGQAPGASYELRRGGGLGEAITIPVRRPASNTSLRAILSHDEGKILRQVMEHVVDWLGEDWGRIKTSIRAVEGSVAETASIALQQEILEFACDHLETFKSALTRKQLAQRLHEGNAAEYQRRFAAPEWVAVLRIVRSYVGSSFREEWVSDWGHSARESSQRKEEQAAAVIDALLGGFENRAGYTLGGALRRTLGSHAFREELGQWLTERYGQDLLAAAMTATTASSGSQ
ncbi:hypothetical protein LEL_10982 [Akanthomyces lecanii RCEF 1005]|uniref:Uncharacterized protein n=1 Tax=Akanthomyces lecanii RCEF 1005 TaxID=1081108 RepID=A0A167NP04_CORDF|nr:hypothetical protein LEL_10982 [Akanthomyces lecanii RCEF 1005]